MGYGIVMALIDNMKKKPVSKKTSVSDKNKLEQDELIVILNLIKQSTFQGADVEKVYNTVLKVQNQLKDVSDKS